MNTTPNDPTHASGGKYPEVEITPTDLTALFKTCSSSRGYPTAEITPTDLSGLCRSSSPAK